MRDKRNLQKTAKHDRFGLALRKAAGRTDSAARSVMLGANKKSATYTVAPLLEATDHDANDEGELVCDIAIIGGGIAFQHAVRAAAKGGAHSVTACIGNSFLEFSHAAPIFLADHTQHRKYLCGEPERFVVPGVRYVADVVTRVDPEEKTISFGHRKATLRYRALIVATGRRLPLLTPRPGDSLIERMDEVRNVARCLAKATSVLCVGAGLIGVEVAADIRIRHPHLTRVYLLSKTGAPLSESHPLGTQIKVAGVLQKLDITVVKGELDEEQPDGLVDVTTPQLVKGSAKLAPGASCNALAPGQEIDTISFDIFLPTYSQGPNTTFLAGSGVLDKDGRIEATSCLQSKVCATLIYTSSHARARRPNLSQPLPAPPLTSPCC